MQFHNGKKAGVKIIRQWLIAGLLATGIATAQAGSHSIVCELEIDDDSDSGVQAEVSLETHNLDSQLDAIWLDLFGVYAGSTDTLVL